MRLALLQDHLRNGGTEQQTLAIAEGMARAGIETHIVVFRRGGTLEEQAQLSRCHIHFLPQGPLKTDWFAPGLHRLLLDLRIEALIAMGRMANCHAGLLTGKAGHAYKIVATFRTGRPIPFLYRRALRRADAVVANSREALQRLQSELHIDRPQASHVIYNGCIRDFGTVLPSFASPAPAPLAARPIRFCSISMFRPQKKQIRLLRMCQQLPSEIDWRLVLAGSGPELKQCQDETRRLGLSERVSFPGLLKDPRALYFESDIALHASDQESLPNFLVESQMSGLPIVAYDVNGVAETFENGKSGFLVERGDEETFVEKLALLCRDESLRGAMSESAQAFAQSRFTLAAQTAAYRSLLVSLVGA